MTTIIKEKTMNLLPAVKKYDQRDGNFLLTEKTKIAVQQDHPAVRMVAERLAGEMRVPTGFPLPLNGKPDDQEVISLELCPRDEELGDEGYRLTVSKGKVNIAANTPAGLQHGTQTFLQLLPPQISAECFVPRLAMYPLPEDIILPDGWEVPRWTAPCCEIMDKPRFEWRGFMLDCSRHFHSVKTVKWCIDLMVQLKMNRLHLHLSDNSGWRVEIPSWPLLTEKGSKTELHPKRHGFYTISDIKEIVDYAAARNIIVIPEIDVPGHVYAVVSSYPELCCTGNPIRYDMSHFHQLDILCAGSEKVDKFIQDVFNHLMDIFPSPYIHLGGDEAPKNRWRKCPACAEKMRQEGISDVEELQGHFVNRVAEVIRQRGRRPIAWDCIMGGNPEPDVIIHWWNASRGVIAPLEAIKKGHEVICSRSDWNYFRAWDDQLENFYFRAEYLPREYIGFREQRPQPYPDPEEWNKIIGAECCMWTEDTPSELLPERLFPEILANAELQWAYTVNRDLNEFRKRARYRRPTFERVQMVHWGG